MSRGGWGRVLILSAVLLTAGTIALLVLINIVGDIQTNTDRLNRVEQGFCARLQLVRAAENRSGAIIFTVLTAVTRNVRNQGAKNRATEYRRLGLLPQFQPPTNCRQALRDPRHYVPPTPIPFARLDKRQLLDLLGKRTVSRKP